MNLKGMSYAVLLVFAFLFSQAGFLVQAEEGAWQDTLAHESGVYSVELGPQKKKVEVKRIGEEAGAPPYLRMRILRKDDRPLEIRLHAIDSPKKETTFTGGLDRWNDSYMGFELEFSFDKKSWKKIGRKIKKVFPAGKN